VSRVAGEIRRRTGSRPTFGERTATWAWGLPILIDGRVRAVICPLPEAVPPVSDRLASVLLYVADTRERDFLAAHAAPGQRIVLPDS